MNTTRRICVAMGFCVASMLTGCATMTPEDRSAFVRMRSDIDAMDEKVNLLNERLNTMEGASSDLRRDIQTGSRMSGQEKNALDQRLRELDQRITAVDSARAKDRDEIVKKLSGQIANVINSGRSSGGGGASAAQPSGNSHVVKPGETLSAIAKAYGVSLDALIRANQLSSANAIRAGQRLTIPQ